MIGLFARLFGRKDPVLSEATPRDAAAIASIHAKSFNRGWSEDEIERLLIDRNVLSHRALAGRRLVGFILSRMAAGEAEILSVTVAHGYRGHGLARRLLELHLRRLSGLGTHVVFLEVDENNAPARALYRRAGFQEAGRREGYYSGAAGGRTAALILRRDLS